MEELKKRYGSRAEQFGKKAGALRKKFSRFAWVRLASFATGVALSIWLFSWHWWAGALFFMAFLAAFYRLIEWHRQIIERARHMEQLQTVNELELRGLGMDLTGFYEGNEFKDPSHPYSDDLDLFGPHSLFQLLCRAGTSGGRQRLAQYLLAPAPLPLVLERQQAVLELRPMLDWRQNFQAIAVKLNDDPVFYQRLQRWLREEKLLASAPWLRAALWVISVWSAVALALWHCCLPWQLYLLTLLPAALILRKTQHRVNDIHRRTSEAVDMLEHYSRLIAHLEGGSFSSPLTARLHSYFSEGAYSASKNLKRLAYIISQLNVRMNFFAIFLNLWGLWDLQWVLRLERWKKMHSMRLQGWLEALQEFEALSSVANAWYNHPNWTLPHFSEEKKFIAVMAGHPLIRPEVCVGNDLDMPVRSHIKLITGSNMAGKSTLLRTVGVNLVLAQAGAPVCAASLSMPRLQLYTSMRTQDALRESTSSFYAELKRLKLIIEAVKAANQSDTQHLPVFFLLDEILKGTNSVDRHTGATALIRQLIRLQGGGLIATHDLELGKMEAEAGGAIENLRMEVEIKGGQLHFDYKLRKGVSHSFNATLLMKQMGIEIEEH